MKTLHINSDRKSNKITSWFKTSLWAKIKTNKIDIMIAGLLLVIAGTVSGINMSGYPQRFEDEGTYVSQAYAVEYKHELAHYTYWYDHPPVGWIQIAGYTTVTNAFARYNHTSAISAGREFMLVIHLAIIVMMFALARRLKIGSAAAGIGILAYALSPLSVEFSRYVLLDNVALPWLLASFYLALSPKRNLRRTVGVVLDIFRPGIAELVLRVKARDLKFRRETQLGHPSLGRAQKLVVLDKFRQHVGMDQQRSLAFVRIGCFQNA